MAGPGLLGAGGPALGLVEEGSIFVDVDLFPPHGIVDLLGPLDGLLADDDLFGYPRFLLDVDRCGATDSQWQLSLPSSRVRVSARPLPRAPVGTKAQS